MRTISTAVLLALATALAAPAAAQSGAPAPTMVIYGAQKCPTDASGNEIVVCVRRPSAEQFRIPKELRELKVTPENESWAARGAANADVGKTGVGTCSTVGASGSTGCFVQQGRLYKREKQNKQADQRAVEAALP